MLKIDTSRGIEGTPHKDLCAFLLSKEQIQVKLSLKFQGCESRALAPYGLLGSPLISLYLALKGIIGKTVLFCLGPEVLRRDLKKF